MNGESISISGIVQRLMTEAINFGKNRVTFGIPFCIEFRDVREKSENMAWMSLVQALHQNSFYNPSLQMGIIVDSDLDNLDQYNTRKLPIYGEFYLHENIKLIYASSEVRENAANVAIALAERESKHLLNYILREKCNHGLVSALNKPYSHVKRWDCSVYPQR